MFKAKNYSDKLPNSIKNSLKQFTNNDCLLVKRMTDDFGLERRSGNCHFNVMEYVDAFGGEVVNGWLLYRNKRLLNIGMWIWSFHSIWLTDKNELLDITDDKQYQNNAFSTFIPDANRRVNFEEGINFNNIVIFENKAFAKHYGNTIGIDIEVGEIYWISDDMLRLRTLVQHSGEYRWLHKEYKNNIARLHEKYGIAIVDGKLVKTDVANDEFSSDLLFDYSLSCAA